MAGRGAGDWCGGTNKGNHAGKPLTLYKYYKYQILLLSTKQISWATFWVVHKTTKQSSTCVLTNSNEYQTSVIFALFPLSSTTTMHIIRLNQSVLLKEEDHSSSLKAFNLLSSSLIQPLFFKKSSESFIDFLEKEVSCVGSKNC